MKLGQQFPAILQCTKNVQNRWSPMKIAEALLRRVIKEHVKHVISEGDAKKIEAITKMSAGIRGALRSGSVQSDYDLTKHFEKADKSGDLAAKLGDFMSYLGKMAQAQAQSNEALLGKYIEEFFNAKRSISDMTKKPLDSVDEEKLEIVKSMLAFADEAEKDPEVAEIIKQGSEKKAAASRRDDYGYGMWR